MENRFNKIHTNMEQRENPHNYRFETLDPRPIPAAEERNNRVFEGNNVVGIEVTVPKLAERCVVNIDPQHTGGNADVAAIEEAVTCELPEPGSVFATVRADIDSVGAMAVLLIRSEDGPLDDDADAMDRVRLIAESDKFANEGYPGPRPLPSREAPWSGKTDETLAAIAAQVSDFRVSFSDRVLAMKEWIKTGKESEAYRTRVNDEKQDIVNSLENGEVDYELQANSRIAFVETTHRAATLIGYSLAPVVVAFNPSFKQHDGDPYRKFTICTYEPKFADIGAALAELSELEPGWGGSPTIGGSPQGVSSELSKEQVVSIVEKHLKED